MSPVFSLIFLTLFCCSCYCADTAEYPDDVLDNISGAGAQFSVVYDYEANTASSNASKGTLLVIVGVVLVVGVGAGWPEDS